MPVVGKILEFEQLLPEWNSMGRCAYNASYSMQDRKDFAPFPSNKLNYSVVDYSKKSDAMILGWNHAALIEYRTRGQGGPGYYLSRIYNFAPNPYHVYYVAPNGSLVSRWLDPSNGSVTKRHAGKDWYVINMDEEKGGAPFIKKLVTFGVSSCSFSVLWPDDFRFLAVSHLSGKPPVPLVSIAQAAAKRLGRFVRSVGARKDSNQVAKSPVHYNLLASVHPDRDELKKFEAKSMDVAEPCPVHAGLLSRGPVRFGVRKDIIPLYMPNLWHACIGIETVIPEDRGRAVGGIEWLVRGMFGCNANFPTGAKDKAQAGQAVLYKEWGWDTLGEVFAGWQRLDYIGSKGPSEILSEVAGVVKGAYGFASLHEDLLNAFHEACLNNPFKQRSKPLNSALSKYSKSKCKCPDNICGKEEAAFRLVEFVGQYHGAGAFGDEMRKLKKLWTSPDYMYAKALAEKVWLKHRAEFVCPLRDIIATLCGDVMPRQKGVKKVGVKKVEVKKVTKK